MCILQLVKLQQQLAEKDKQLAEAQEVPQLMFKVTGLHTLSPGHLRADVVCLFVVSAVLVRHVNTRG